MKRIPRVLESRGFALSLRSSSPFADELVNGWHCGGRIGDSALGGKKIVGSFGDLEERGFRESIISAPYIPPFPVLLPPLLLPDGTFSDRWRRQESGDR